LEGFHMSLKIPFRGMVVGDQFQTRTYITKPDINVLKPELLDWREVRPLATAFPISESFTSSR